MFTIEDYFLVILLSADPYSPRSASQTQILRLKSEQNGLYQFFMRLHRIRSPLTPLNKGGIRKYRSKSPLKRGI